MKAMKRQLRNVLLPGVITTLVLGATALKAQVVPAVPSSPISPAAPPRPPRPPRSPRPPHAPRSWFGSNEGVAKIDTVIPFSSTGTVDLSLLSGAIKLSTWDRNEVRVFASTTGEPSLQFDATGSRISLEQASSGRWNLKNEDNRNTATFEVTVPIGARAMLSAVSGSIDVSGLRGTVDVSSWSGAVDVRDVGSSLTVHGVSGRITATNIAKDARVENMSGSISVNGVGGTLSAETVSGTIAIAGVRGDQVHATSVSGSIDFSGPVGASARYEFQTISGRTDLKLASNANASVSVETFSGSISNGYPGAVRVRNSDPDDDQKTFRYAIGRGEGRVRVEAFSGTVHISQGNP